MVRKKEIKCPHCKESNDITISSYILNIWSDPPETAIECCCRSCGRHFYPEEEEEQK